MTRDEIIYSLLDQAQDKDCLANGDETSIFTEDAKALREAADLLKAQEPKLVTNIHKEHNNVLNPNVPWVGKCPKCGKKIEGRNLTRFCKFCGQAVKWDD